MRFLEVPALITEDIEVPDIVDITEPITASIDGTTLIINGQDTDPDSTREIVSGEATITLTGDVNINAVSAINLRKPSIHKISVKTNGKGNFTYTPNTGVTASSVSSTIKTGSDFEILLITTADDDTYLDLDLADYTSPAVNFSNVLTGFDITDLTSTYGATAKLYKPDGTLLTTVSSAGTGSAVGFGSGVETTAQAVTYKLEVTDDLGRKSTYNLPRKWISYAMETSTTPGLQKFKLGANEYTSTTVVPNLSSTTKARIYKTSDHGYLGINFIIQGRDSTSGAWTDIISDNPPTNVESDESAEFLAFGDYIYHRVWVKPTAQASTSVTSDGVVTLTLSNVTESVTTTSISGKDPYSIDETSNVYVFDETAKFGSVPLTITLGSETYSNATTATINQTGTVPNTDFSTSKAISTYGASGWTSSIIFGSDDAKYICVTDTSDTEKMYVYKGDPSTGSYALYGGTGGNGLYQHADYASDDTNSEGSAMSWDGKYMLLKKYYKGDLTIFKNNETDSTFEQLIANLSPATESTSESWGVCTFIPNSYDFVMTKHAHANYGFRIVYFENSGDTWTEKWTWENPNSGGLTHSSTDTKWGRYGFSLSRDKKYAVVTSYANPTGVAVLKVDLENTTTQNKFEKVWEETISGGVAGAMSPDGKYIIAGNQKIFKNNDAGDWTTKTEIQSDFTNNTIFTHYCIFLGDKYVACGNESSKHLFEFYPNKEITLTYNGKDRLTLAHKGGLTTTSVKLYKDGTLYHTFGDETIVFIEETGVYQAIADDTYYSNKVTVTTVTETEARLYINNCTTFLLKKDGKVWYWGESANGSNGMGNNTEVALPTLNTNLNALPSGIKQIGNSANDLEPNTLITNDGKLYTWGKNNYGGLGRGNETDYTDQGPWLVDTQSSNTFTFCHSSGYENFALQDNGYLWSCGYGGYYVLGNGSNSNINIFGRIDLANVIDFHANHYVALAVTSENKVYIWGTESNSSMAGFSTTATPTHLTALDGKNIVKVRSGGYQGHAISSDGKLYSWGKNDNAQIPKGTSGNISTPTEMTWFSRKNIKVVDVQLSYDDDASCLALDDQGNMYVWGAYTNQSSGDYTLEYTYHWPVLLKTNVASISVGMKSCGCIDKFGQVYTWGDGAKGVQNWIHGANSDTDITVPTSNNLSVGSSILYDGSDKYVFGKGSTVTSEITFGSNTVSLDTKSEVFVTDPHTYKFKIMDTDSVTYTSNVVSSTPARPTGRVYPPKSGTHKSITTSTSANGVNSWTIDGALYGNGAYKASMDKAINSSEYVYLAFNGMVGYTHLHTSAATSAAIQLHMPQKIKLTKYAMYSRNFTSEYNQAPKTWKVYGSNDETTWTELDSQTNQTVTAWGDETDHRDTKREYTVTGNTKYFSSYKLDVTTIGGGSYVVISQIEYYGDEEGFLSDDGFGKLTLDVKGDTNATSNITFYSNTYAMGAARDLYIKDEGEYSANIYGSSKAFLGEKTYTVSENTTRIDYTNATSFYYGGGVVDNTGKLYTWGHNGFGDSGRGASDRVPTHISSISDPVSNVWRGDPGYTMAAKTSTDKWYMWGRNTYNAVLGNTTNTGNVTEPEDVTAKVTTYFGDQTVSTNKIIKMAMGEHHAAALTSGGKVWSWGGESQNWPFGSEGHKIYGNGDPEYYKCVSVSGTTYLYKRPNKPSNHGSEIKFVADSTTGSGRYTGTWQDASSVNYPNAFQDPSLHPTFSGTPSYTPTHNDTTLYLYNNENSDATCTVDYSTEMPTPFKNTTDGTTELSNITDIQSTFHGTAAFDSSGNVWFWGTNSTMSYTYPTKILDSSSTPGVVGMATNGKSFYAWKSDGTFYTRGAGDRGQLANGASSDQYTSWQPVTTLQGKTIKKVFGGNENMFVWTDDGVYGAGRGNNYKNGDGGTGNNTVFGKSNTISALSIKEIDFGHATGLVVTTDGKGYMWGEDSSNSMANALSGNQSGAAEATSISALSISPHPSPPALNFDGYNKLTIDNTYDKSRLTVPVVQVESGFNFSSVHADHVNKLGYPFPASGPWAHHHFVKVGTDGDKVLFDLLYVGTTGNPNSTTTVAFDTKTGIWSDPHPGNDPDSFSSTESGTYTSTLTITSNNSEVHFKRGNGTYLGFITLTGWDKTVADNVYTIKKDDAAFATTTSNTVYIREAGTYTAEVKGSGAYVAEVSKDVSGIATELEWKTPETHTFYPGSVTTEDRFGNAVAFDGNYAIIGSNNNDSGGDNRGMVYIFHKSGGTWTQQASLQSKHIHDTDNFGMSVDISGDYAIVGAFLYDEDWPDEASNRGAAYIFKREGTAWRQQTHLQPSDPGADDYFGNNVRISGDYAIVGSPYNNSPADSGSSYVFKKTSTTLSTVRNPYFTAYDAIETNSNWSSSTGFEITASGDPGSYSQKWRAFDNTYTGVDAWESTWLSQTSMPAWLQIQYPEDVVIKSYTIVGRDATDRYIPTSWQLQGATAAAPSTYVNLETNNGNRTASSWAPLAEVSHDVNTPNTAYRYFRLYVNSSNESNQVSINQLKLFTTPLSGQSGTVDDSWAQEQKLTASDAASYDEFGLCADLSGDYAIIGANSGSQRPGSAYIFKRSGTSWSQQAKLQASDGATGDRFGKDVALSGDYAIAGAYNDDTATGSAYIFKKDTGAETWSQQQKLTASDGATSDSFGWSVDITGDTAVVGAYYDDSNKGSAYIFERSGTAWTEVKKITASGGAGGNFGNEVFVDGTTVLVGSPLTDTKGANTGAAYIYEKGPVAGPSLNFDGYNKLTIDGCDYADTSKVTKRGGTTYDIGTAKTMYVKDEGDYDLEVSGSDKFVAATVNVGSVDLTGATTKPIDFDGFNKLTLIDAGANAVSNVSLNGGTKQELGSATSYFIKDHGTYALEMSGSNVFALSRNVVPTFDHTFMVAPTISSITFPGGGWVGGTWVHDSAQDVNNNDMIMKVFESSAGSTSSTRGWCFVYYKTGSKAGKQFINVNLPDPDNNTGASPGGIKRIRAGVTTGSQSTDELEYATGDTIEFYNSPGTSYNVALAIFTVDNSMNFKTAAAYITELHPGLTFDGNNKLTVSNFDSTDQEWPPLDGTLSSFTVTNSDKDAEWTISGASYGNGTYKAKYDKPIHESHHPGLAFDRVEDAATNEFHSDNNEIGNLSIEFPETVLIDSYELRKMSPSYSGNGDHSPTDWTFEGSNDGTTWVTLDTQSGFTKTNWNTLPTRKFTINGNSTAYKHYRLVVSAVVTTYLTISEMRFYKKNPRTGTLTDPSGGVHTLGQTQDTIYIHQQGDYTLDVQNNDQKAIVTKTVSGTIAPNPLGNYRSATVSGYLDYGSSSDRAVTICFWGKIGVDSTTDNGGRGYIRLASDNSTSSYGNNHAFGIYNAYEPGNTRIQGWTALSNNSVYTYWVNLPSGYDRSKWNFYIYTYEQNGGNHSLYLPEFDYHDDGDQSYGFAWRYVVFDMADADDNFITDFSIYEGNKATTESWRTTLYNGGQIGGAANETTDRLHYLRFHKDTMVDDTGSKNTDLTSSMITRTSESLPGGITGSPSLTFDTYNKLMIANVDSDATSNIDYFSNTYEMGSRKELIINDAGTYYGNIHSSNTLALVKNQVGTITDELEWKANESQIVYAGDGVENDEFGKFVSVDGDYAIVGAIGGLAAYIFYKSGGTWTQQAILTGSDTGSGDEFGTCVSIKGDYAVVAARGHNTYAGAAYVFVRSGVNWTQQQKLTASDAADSDKLATCSIDGDYIILGAWGDNTHTGAVYIFKRSGVSWSQQQKITASNAGTVDQFGSAISLSGDYAVISAWSEDTAGGDAGSAYIFKRGAGTETWTEEAIIRGDTIDADDRLGDVQTGASISGDYAIVGSRYQDTGGADRGSAYIFKRSGASWSQQAQLQPSDTADSDMFGYSVSINGSIAVVGTAEKDSGKGAVYIFERSGTTWTEVKKITASDAEDSDKFGSSVATDGTTIFVGACGEDTKGSLAGAAYIYEKGLKAGPSLTFDGYNKLTAPVLRDDSPITTPPSVINFHSDGSAEDWASIGYVYHNITNTASGPQTFQLRNSSGAANGDGSQYNISIDFQTSKYVCADVGSSAPHRLMVGDGSAPSSIPTTTTVDLINPTDYLYIFQSTTNVNGYSILDIQGPDLVSTVITKTPDSYDIGTASSLYIDAGGTYDAQAKNSNTFMIKTSNTVNAVASKPVYTNIWGGEETGMIIDSDGKLYTWGDNGNDESGRSTGDDTPTHISTISDPVSNVWVEGAPGRTRIVKTSTDKWYMWGMNYVGSASIGKIFGESGEVHTPVDVTSAFTTHFGAQGTSDTTRIIKVVMSSNACSALAADGKVWSWGQDGNRNELGKNTNTVTSTPFKNTTDGTTELSNITDICSLHYGKIALDSNGDVWQWGTLRTGSTGYPTKQTGLDSITIIGIGAGFFTAYAWDAAGNIYTLGQGTEGQLGNGADSDQDSTWQTVTTLQGQTIHGIYGGGYSVMVHASGGIYFCGQGSNGQLGMGNSDALNVFTKNTTLSALSIYKIDFGNGPGYCITTDGKGYAWGKDNNNSIPTPLSGDQSTPVEASSFSNLSLVYQPPAITYDNSNKLSIEGVTNPSTNLTFGSVTTNIGSAKDVYIRDAGTYSFHTNDGNQALLMSNVVSTTPSGTTYDDSHNQITNIGLNKEIDSVSGYFGQYTHGATTDSEITNDLNFTKTILTNGYPTDFSVVGVSQVRGDQTLEDGQWHSSYTTSTISPYFRINLEKDHFVDNCVLHRTAISSTRYSNVRFQLLDSSETQIKEVDVGGFGATDTFVTADCKVSGVRYVKVVTTTTSYTHYDEIRINGYVSTLLDVSGTTPSQVYDTSNTFTVSNIPSTQTGITGKFYKDATAYTIHVTEPTSNVVIKSTGTYVSVFKTASTVYISNAWTVDAITDVGTNTIEDEAPPPVTSTISISGIGVFHHGTFVDGGNPYGHADITAAATAGYFYSDTAPGTYDLGTLDETPTFVQETAAGGDGYGKTTYKFTTGDLTSVDHLLVAGGGGGGGDMGGGGGAGGYLETTGTTISAGQKEIVVGGGGIGSSYTSTSSYRARGRNGADTSVTGLTTAIGGGGGATGHNNSDDIPGGNGGSGGGGSGGRNSGGGYGEQPGTGTAGQGYDGAYSGDTYYPGGGGGASEKGYGRNGTGGNNHQPHGGDGKQSTITGFTSYYFAGGGGGNGHSSNGGNGGKGGGGGGASNHTHGTGDTNGLTNGGNGDGGTSSDSQEPPSNRAGGDGGKHTGGGGGGAQHHYNTWGGNGGSGIVIIKANTQKTITIPSIAGSTAIADPEPVADAPSLTLDATTEVATPTMDLNFTTDLTSFPKSVGRYNISTHDTLGVVFDRTATKKKRVTKTINTDKFSMALTANNAASGTIGDLVTFGNFTLAANTTTSGEHSVATNFDGEKSNVYVDGVLVTQTTPSPSITSGAKLLTLGQNYAGRIKDFKFWNKPMSYLGITVAFHYFPFASGGDPYSDGSITAAATAGHVYSDTEAGTYTWGTLGSADTVGQQAVYTWTPISGSFGAKILMVAGGGGGAMADNGNGGGGGGGAGGLVYNASVSLSGEQTIKVGGPNSAITNNGTNTEFTGLTTAIGGGKGEGGGGGGASGGSGGGGFRSYSGYAGTAGQGYAGGDGNSSGGNNQGGSGGGGAGGAGAGANGANGANGGVGLDYSSVFGTAYGDSGWFASGGGGGFHSGSPGTASNGGGGAGGSSGGSAGGQGQKHTGGGGGGGSIAATTDNGSYGGSGIVLIKY